MEIENLEQKLNEGFIPYGDAIELANAHLLELYSEESIGFYYNHHMYWFKAVQGGLKLYLEYEVIHGRV